MSDSYKNKFKNKTIDKKSSGELISSKSKVEVQTTQLEQEPILSNEEPLTVKQNGSIGITDSHINDSPNNFNTPESVSTAKKKTREEINNLEQFIAYAYTRKGRHFSLKKKELKVVSEDPKLDEDAKKRLMAFTKADVFLKVPRQLLLMARELKINPLLKSEIQNFVRDVLKDHAVFRAPELTGVLENHPNALSPRATLAKIATTDYSYLKWFKKDKPLKPKDYQELIVNTVYCLVVWFADTRGIAFETLNQYLFESLWKPKTSSIKNDAARFRVLTEIIDLGGVGLACQIFKQQGDRLAQIAESANKAQEVAIIENQTLQESLAEYKLKLEQRDQDIVQLKQVIEEERQNFRDTCIHLQDDIEKLRTRLLRRLKTEVDLLDEGLFALRRDPPKIHVMDDHAERALEGLKKEIKELNTEK